MQRTGREGGGFQVWLRCPEPGRNEKLAWVPDEAEDSGRKVAIEIKGEGGYVWPLAAFTPSRPTLPSHCRRLRQHSHGAPGGCRCPDSSGPQVGRSPFDPEGKGSEEAREAAAKTSTKYRAESNGQGSIIDAYNERATIGEALERMDTPAWASATSGPEAAERYWRDGRSFHHSSNDALNDGYWHRPFDLYCQCEHGGEIKAAVKAAAEHLGLRHLPSSGQSMEEKTQPETIDYHPLTCAQLNRGEIRDSLLCREHYGGWSTMCGGCARKPSKRQPLLIGVRSGDGRIFLGRFKVPEPVAVGFFSGESGLPTLAETLRRIARAAGHDPSGVRNLIVSDRVPQIGSLDHLAAIDALYLNTRSKVIHRPGIHGDGWCRRRQIVHSRAVLRRVSEVCQVRGCTLAFVAPRQEGVGQPLSALGVFG